MPSDCCHIPPREGGASDSHEPAVIAHGKGGIPDRAVRIAGGKVQLGTRRPYLEVDGEADMRTITVRPFRIDPYSVTNEWFARFVAETGYVTEAEKFGWSFVFHEFVKNHPPTQGVAAAPWWRRIDGAQWNAPFGPGSSIDDILDHPVVHVSWNDARVFAEWAGGRLPNEAEWVHAARGGLESPRFPWGEDEPEDGGPYPCNIWQGTFPNLNTLADGFLGTAPVGSFAPNGYGLYNMAGNVWEWCEDRFRVRSLKKAGRAHDEQLRRNPMQLTKGGSYLCHRSYCYRYRIDARSGSTADSSTGHMGFRIVWPESAAAA